MKQMSIKPVAINARKKNAKIYFRILLLMWKISNCTKIGRTTKLENPRTYAQYHLKRRVSFEVAWKSRKFHQTSNVNTVIHRNESTRPNMIINIPISSKPWFMWTLWTIRRPENVIKTAAVRSITHFPWTVLNSGK